MAKEDDLSVNINVGVDLDKDSFKKAKEELQFILELQKELGLEGVSKVRVGGYSTGNSPDKVSRNKAAKQFEKMGGDWTGVDIADKAQAELAKQFNQASKELAKLFNIDFIPDAAAALGQIDFSMPDPEKIFNTSASAKDYNDKLQKATEDFFMDALGEVTISPAMFLAAAEKVMKGNPELYMPRGLENAKALSWMQTGGQINPTSIFKGRQALEANPEQVARFDKVAEENIAKYGGEKMAAAFTYAIGKDLDEIVIGAWEKASKEVASNKDVQKILADDPTFSISGIAASDAFANLEIYFMERFVENVKEGEIGKGYQSGTFASNLQGIKSASRGDTLINLPDDPMNALPKDKIINWLDTMIEDGIMHPLQQVMENPAILGKAFISQSESAIKSGFTRLVKESSGETTLSKKAQEEKRYNDQVLADIKAQVEAHKELNDLKAKSPETAATTGGGGAGNPDIEMLRKYLTEQKALVEQSGKTFMVGLDTEFNSQIDEKLTELGMVIKDGSGKFVEIFKFLQLPGDTQAMYKGSAYPPGNARTPADLAKRGELLGISKEDIGVPNDSEANFLQYREKISKLVSILDLLSELGISLTGSSFQSAEAANIKKAIDYINSKSKDMGLDPLATPDLKNVFDPATLAKKLAPASSELTKIFDSPEAKAGISGALGNLIKNISQQFPEFIARYSDQFRMSENANTFEYKAEGGSAQAHYALTDAAASLIVKDFVEEFGGMAATMLVPVAKDLNTKVQAAAGGSGGGKGPNVPMAAGDKPEDDPYANRAAQSIQKLLLTGKKYENAITGLTEKEIVKVNLRLGILQKSQEQAELLGKIAELEKKRSQILAEAAEVSATPSNFLSQRGRSEGQLKGPLTEEDANLAKRYNDQIKAASMLSTQIRELEEAGRSRERQVISTVKEEARHNQVSEQLTDNFRKQYDANLQNAQAGKTATTAIKAQMQEQVNAQKAVQKQTQSLVNTWITARYALYDVGNFYTNVAQNLLRVSRQIFDTTQSYRSFETSFTSVERAMQLTSEQAFELRNEFIGLSEQIPISFEEIARIGTLGAQMGIASSGILEFTETVAEFSAITGISADTVAQKFGKIAELADVDTADFDKLGSAVAFAGINAVATEAEILTLSESIAAVANQSGMTAPEVIGLATALASVGVPAEQARGVFTRVFADLDRVANTGGESLANFAQVAGMSSQQFAASWGKEGMSGDVFVSLLEGIDASENLTETFDKLNIVETREINTLTRLAKNLNVVRQALQDSNSSFEDGVFLGDSFEKTADNLDAKIIIFKNNLDSLAAAFSSGIAEPLKDVVDIGSEFLKFLKGASESWFFKNAAFPIAGLVVTGAAIAGITGILAKATAQILAFRVAMVNAANDTTLDSLTDKIKGITGIGSQVIEIRTEMTGAGIKERGLMEPVSLPLLTNEKNLQKTLLETKNIYVASGEAMKGTTAAKIANAKTGIDFARLEADAVRDAIASQSQVIADYQLQLDDMLKLKNTEAGRTDKVNDARILETSSMIENLKTRQYYSTIHDGQVKIIDEDTLATYRNITAKEASANALLKENQARAGSAVPVNLNTGVGAVPPVTGVAKVLGVISKFIGIAGVIFTVIGAVEMLVSAFSKLNQVDLLAAGGGVESLQEAIKKDTEEVAKGNMEAVTTLKIGQDKLSKSSDKAAESIKELTGAQTANESGTDAATRSIEGQTLALGDNTKAWIANAIANDPALSGIDLTESKNALENIGMDFDQILMDMASKANGVNIDPFKGISDRLKEIAVEANEIARTDPKWQTNPRIKELEEEVAILNKTRDILKGISPALDTAFAKMNNEDILKSIMGLNQATNAILDLSDAYSEAANSGDGTEAVLSQIKEAAIEVSGVTSEGDLLKIRTADSIEALREVIASMYEAAKAAQALSIASVSDLQKKLNSAQKSKAPDYVVSSIQQELDAAKASSDAATQSVDSLKNAMTSVDSIIASSGPSKQIEDTEKKIRTLTDYANDLRSVLQAAFDIRYQKQVGIDAIESSWSSLRKAAEDATQAIEDANAALNESFADRDVLEYQLSVAERYDDEKRAAVLRARLAKLNNQIIDQEEQLTEANDNSSKSLSGNSDSAIQNRSSIRDMVTQYNGYLVALANSGMSNDELKAKADELKQEFLNQGVALGFAEEELKSYTDAFATDFKTVVDGIPRNITVKADADPAKRAVDEFVQATNNKSATVKVNAQISNIPDPVQVKKAENLVSALRQERSMVVRFGGSTTGIDQQIATAMSNLMLIRGYFAGGYVEGEGTATSDSIPAMLSRGEYVVKASSVSAYGLDFMNALNQQKVGFQPASQSMNSMSSSNSSVVYLSPEDRALLRAAVDRPINLYTDNGKIASSANAGNVLLAQRGAR